MVLAVPTFPVDAPEKEIVGNLAAIVIDTVAVLVKLDEFVIVIVWLVAPWAQVGVPLITQLVAFILRPEGRDPVQFVMGAPPLVNPVGEILIAVFTCPDVPLAPE
jgi:hypothetical protein